MKIRTSAKTITKTITKTIHSALTVQDVKLCCLCGALNHKNNGECWTCRWHGAFQSGPDMVALAWQRLEHQFEEVRLEHITSRNLPALDEFGTPRPVSGWPKLGRRLRIVWANFQTARNLRMAQRDARLRSRTLSKPDSLGV